MRRLAWVAIVPTLACTGALAARFGGALPLLAQTALQAGEVNHLFYDVRNGRLLALAGSKETMREQVWARADGHWTLVAADGPAARELGGAAYDSRRQRIVLHGGMGRTNSNEILADTWEWDGAAWHRPATPAVGPRDHHAMAYDDARGRTVLFGGRVSTDALGGDTWEWDGIRWERKATEGPGGRAHFALAYDARGRRILLFGGMTESYRVEADTWAWDGRRWEKIAVQGPPARSHYRMAADPRRGIIVLFGGLRGGDPRAALGDTWVWDGQAWREAATTGPAARSGHAMTYDAGRQRIVLYGGGAFDGRTSTRYDDLWEWEGSRWTAAR